MRRREFLKQSGLFVAGTLLTSEIIDPTIAQASEHHKLDPNTLGVVVDTTICIGCRKCELACDRKNKLTNLPEKSFDDTPVLKNHRDLCPTSNTIVNKYPNPKNHEKPFFVKTQCNHCNRPSCVSACIVGALRKQPSGAVTYDYDKCIGCRYCMVACPYQVPKYEFTEPLRPRVMKCNFCQDRISTPGGTPACVDACPVSAMTFGWRNEIIAFARARIAKDPRRYIPRIYGLKDTGGASWMYLAGVPFPSLDFPTLGDTAPPDLSEGIQHSVFKHWIPPVSLYALLAASMWLFRRRDENAEATKSYAHGGGA